MPPAARLTRRRLLAILGVSAVAGPALLAGCREEHGGAGSGQAPQHAPAAAVPTATPGSSPSGQPPDETVIAAVLAGERTLIATYDRVLAAHPGLGHRLGPLRAEHVRHADALLSAGGPAVRGTSPTGSPSTSASPKSRSASQRVPRNRAATLRLVRTAEQHAARRASRACLSASAEHAALLGSIAASESTHLVVL